MPRVDLREGEEVEFKRRWTDQALEDLAAFANTRGGAVFVGVDDDGEVLGVDDPEAETQRIANTVVSRLGLVPSITRRALEGREVIEVRVEPARGIIGHSGRYRTRIGSRTSEWMAIPWRFRNCLAVVREGGCGARTRHRRMGSQKAQRAHNGLRRGSQRPGQPWVAANALRGSMTPPSTLGAARGAVVAPP